MRRQASSGSAWPRRAASARALSWVAVLLIAAATAAGCSVTGQSLPDGHSTTDEDTAAPSDHPLISPNAVIERVVDGDTVDVEIDGRKETVRLLGVDAPETMSPTKPVQCYGPEAGAYLAETLPRGTGVVLIRDAELRDQYDRLLAYVVRSDDQLFVNLDLVEQGYATVLAWAPNTYYESRLTAAQSRAESSGAGLWGACGGPDVPLG